MQRRCELLDRRVRVHLESVVAVEAVERADGPRRLAVLHRARLREHELELRREEAREPGLHRVRRVVVEVRPLAGVVERSRPDVDVGGRDPRLQLGLTGGDLVRDHRLRLRRGLRGGRRPSAAARRDGAEAAVEVRAGVGVAQGLGAAHPDRRVAVGRAVRVTVAVLARVEARSPSGRSSREPGAAPRSWSRSEPGRRACCRRSSR